MLLLAGYMLNFLKFVLPGLLHMLPWGVYQELGVERNFMGYLKMLFSVDILQFAGIAYGLIFLISRLPRYPIWVGLLVLLTSFCGPFLYDLHTAHNKLLNYVLDFLCGQPPRAFFPLLPWLVYPLTGLIIGYYIKKGTELIFGYAAVAGFILLSFSCSQWLPFIGFAETRFYRTYTPETLYHLGIVLIWLYIWHVIASHHPHRVMTKLLGFLSRQITLIYFIQWPLICWCLPVLGFRKLGFAPSMLAAASLGSLAIIIACLIIVLLKTNKH